MTLEKLNAQHANPDNWHLVFFYFAPDDPRLVVKKRIGALGWTLNFARPMAIPFCGALIASVYGFMKVADSLITSSQGYWLSVFLLIMLLVGLCGWMSNPARYITQGEQDGAGQPAAGLESKPEGGDKPQPEAEGRSR